MTRFLGAFVSLMAMTALPSFAQDFDSSGNSQLNGNYWFYEINYWGDNTGSIWGATAMFGSITFDGYGGYVITDRTKSWDGSDYLPPGKSSSSNPSPGTYSISASGYGSLSNTWGNPPPYFGDKALQVLVGKDKIVIGSAPNALYEDIFIAVPATSVTNATLNGSYSFVYYNAGSLSGYDSSVSTGVLNANGAGKISDFSLKTYSRNEPNPITQSVTGALYSFSADVGALSISAGAMGGQRFYISPDGNFIFGGGGFNIMVGVRRGSNAAPPLDGLYYQVGFRQNPDVLDTYYGAFSATAGIILEHQQVLHDSWPNSVKSETYTRRASYPNTPATDYTDTALAVDYVVGQNGIRIGSGQSPYLGIQVALPAPDLTSFKPPTTAPYIHPMGVTNAASFAPFTSDVAPGELINIYGANFATDTTKVSGGIQFPTTLDGVQVLINNRLAPLLFVTPDQIAAVVPYATTEPVVQVQVQRNGVVSNVVTSFLSPTAPGIFAVTRNGVGPGAILHANAPYYTLVSQDAPALVGEIVQVFVSGLGAVSPTTPEGGTGGFGPLNQTSSGAITAYIDNLPAQVTYSGLAPGLSGLYQVNVRIPTGSRSGDVPLDIFTPDAHTSQATVNVAAAPAP
jgi:uncharacterized protein (TIGR03437 family)